MFGTRIGRLQKKSSALLDVFTTVADGLKQTNIAATKEIALINDKMLKLADDEMQLIKLTQSNNKVITNIEKIIEEIGDVYIRLKILKQIYPIELIKKRINFKLKKFYKYITTKKYKNI